MPGCGGRPQRPDDLGAAPLLRSGVRADALHVHVGEVAAEALRAAREPLALLLEVLPDDRRRPDDVPADGGRRPCEPAVRGVDDRGADHRPGAAGQVDGHVEGLAGCDARRRRERDGRRLVEGADVERELGPLLGRQRLVAALPGLDEREMLVLRELLLGPAAGRARERVLAERCMAARAVRRRIGLEARGPSRVGRRAAAECERNRCRRDDRSESHPCPSSNSGWHP